MSSSTKSEKALKNFSLRGITSDFDLDAYKGSILVLYFYPKDNTPGCTQEGLDFSRLQPKFKKAGATVFGISRDTQASHRKFAEKQNFKIDLLADPEEKACKMFDVIKEKNMYGRKVIGIERSTFVVGPKGEVLKEWRKVKVAGHAEEVLEFVSGLKSKVGQAKEK